eukprot:gene12571-15795_t
MQHAADYVFAWRNKAKRRRHKNNNHAHEITVADVEFYRDASPEDACPGHVKIYKIVTAAKQRLELEEDSLIEVLYCTICGKDQAPLYTTGRKEKMLSQHAACAKQRQEEEERRGVIRGRDNEQVQGPRKLARVFSFRSAQRTARVSLPSMSEILSNMSAVLASFGTISLADVTFGLQVLQAKHSKTPYFPAEAPNPFAEARVVCKGEALRLLDDLDLASGAYKGDAMAMCAQTRLKHHNVKFWSSNGSFIRPAMFIAVCHIKNELLVVVRGTKAYLDLVINMCGAPHETPFGHTHWGMHQAAELLLNDHVDLLEELARGEAKGYTLKFVGHSLGAGVAALMAFLGSSNLSGTVDLALGVRLGLGHGDETN